MSVPFPERYHLGAAYADTTFGDLETNTVLPAEDRLVLYALRQQADHGPCTQAAPYMWQLTARYKHDAWRNLGQMTKFEAMVHYCRRLDDVKPGWLDTTAATAPILAVTSDAAPDAAPGNVAPNNLSEQQAAVPQASDHSVGLLSEEELRMLPVSAGTVAALISEIVRLRRLAAPVPSGVTGIMTAPVVVEPSPSRQHTAGMTDASAVPTAAASMSLNEPQPLVVSPPSAFPAPATAESPLKLVPATAATATVISRPVRRMTWGEWLGLSDDRREDSMEI